MDARVLTELCRCPRNGGALHWTQRNELRSDSGHAYPVVDGVVSFVEDLTGDRATTREFYDDFGWAPNEGGAFGDTKIFVDRRPGPAAYSRAAMRRLCERYLSAGGEYLLDAGSGPLVDDDVNVFANRFERIVCTDLSCRALRAARRKRGDRGIYLACDIANLPIADGAVDAVTCNHVIYQLPIDLQEQAFRELYRVLKPGGVSLTIYWWSDATLPWRLERVARSLGMRGPGEPEGIASAPAPPHNIRPRTWFESVDWPFAYSYDVYRVVPQLFTRKYIPDDWRGSLFLSCIQQMQRLAPSYCGKYGQMPAIVFKKPKDEGVRRVSSAMRSGQARNNLSAA